MSKSVFLLSFSVLVLCDVTKALLFVSNGQPPLYKDARGYWALGSQIAEGDWLLRHPAQVERPPGYPAFLACAQAACGDYALVATAVTQQMCCVAVSLITAWICGRVTQSNVGILMGLALSVACVSRHIMASEMMSDNLLCLVFAIYLATVVAWFRRPSVALAIALGAIIAVSMLVKPVAQLLWLPTLLLMGIRLYELGCLRRLLSQGAAMVATMILLVTPWFLANYLSFGQPFLAKFSGRALWWSCFDRPPDDAKSTMAGLAFSEGPRTSRVFAEIGGMGINMRHCHSVYAALRKRGCSELASDGLMLGACLEAIREQPGRFALTRVGHFVRYWIIPLGDSWWRFDQRGLFEGETYVGQNIWSCDSLARLHNTLMRHFWKPRLWLYLVATMAVLAGWLAMLLNTRLRPMGVALGLVTGYLSGISALVGQPHYRYRMPLEPVMIVVFVAGAIGAAEMLRARSRGARKSE